MPATAITISRKDSGQLHLQPTRKMSDPRMDQFLKDANICQFLHDEGF